jgi:TraM recognition site of TraD and TraG/FtsK/SpoIIIE family
MRRAWSRYALLGAFFTAFVAPPWVTSVALALGLAMTAYRLGGFVARRAGRMGAGSQTAIALGTSRTGNRVSVAEAEIAAHGLILGASGSGKTTAMQTVLQQQIGRGRPVVAIDMKGSPAFARQLAVAAAAAGRPFRLWTPDGPSHWNPLQHGNATELKDKLICTERFTEPHYQRAAERYVQTVLQVLQQISPGPGPSLGQVVALMDPRRLPAVLRLVPRPLADRVQGYLAGLTTDQLSAIRGLQTRLAIVTESHTGRYLAPAGAGSPHPGDVGPSVDLRAALDGSEVVLFSLNSSRYQSFASQLAAMVVQDLICATGTRLEGPASGRGIEQAGVGSDRGIEQTAVGSDRGIEQTAVGSDRGIEQTGVGSGRGIEQAGVGSDRRIEQATIAIDEFSGIGGEHVVALFARGREAGVGVLLATQEMADLDRAGHGVRDQVLGSTAFKLILRQDVPASARLAAQIAGTEKAWEETRQIGGTLFSAPSGRGTRRQVDRFVIDPNEIQSLPTGEAILISKLRGGRAERIRITPPERLEGPDAAWRPSSTPHLRPDTPTEPRPQPHQPERTASPCRLPVQRRPASTRPAPPPERPGPELG